MRTISVRSVLLASTITISTVVTAYADSQWAAATTTFPGSIRAGSREVPVKPGDHTVITIKNLPTGATVTMLNGAEVLTPKPLAADEKGNLTIPLNVPADAATGLHPLTVITQNPASVSQVMLKLSKVVPPKNTEAFRLQTIPVGERAYQSAVSADGKLFVTSARGPKDGSRLMRLNAGTLAVEAEATLPKDKKGEQIGVFGVGVDNAHNHVWTTNTLAETVYVASQETNNVVVLDADGKVLADTYIGAGGVSVVWDPVTSQVFAATRAGGTVAVLNKDGKLVANIPMDETPNHLTAAPDGAVYVVSMYGAVGDKTQTGSVTKITQKK